MEDEQQKPRWYENHPEIKELMSFIRTLEREKQIFITQQMLQILINECDMDLDSELTRISKNNYTYKRWYDKDPILKEALELLRLSPDETKSEAAEFMLQLQEQVAGEVIEHVYDIINTYQGKGNRWYDNDPMMLKAVELLRNAPPKVQRVAALKLLIALEQKTFEGVEI